MWFRRVLTLSFIQAYFLDDNTRWSSGFQNDFHTQQDWQLISLLHLDEILKIAVENEIICS